jgi:hypothetical protein
MVLGQRCDGMVYKHLITISVIFLVRVPAQSYFRTITHSACIVVGRKIIVLVRMF